VPLGQGKALFFRVLFEGYLQLGCDRPPVLIMERLEQGSVIARYPDREISSLSKIWLAWMSFRFTPVALPAKQNAAF